MTLGWDWVALWSVLALAAVAVCMAIAVNCHSSDLQKNQRLEKVALSCQDHGNLWNDTQHTCMKA